MFISIHLVFCCCCCCFSALLFVCLFIWCWRVLAGRLKKLVYRIFRFFSTLCILHDYASHSEPSSQFLQHNTIDTPFIKCAAADAAAATATSTATVAARIFIWYHKQTVFESLRHICYINAPRWVNNNNLMTDTLSKRQTSCNINKLCAHTNCNRGGGMLTKCVC